MDPELAAAVAELYTVFARHPLAEQIGYCDHCVGDDEALVLQQVPLRELTADQLDRYTRKAMSTWGDAADFQHFLPRLLELVATGAQDDGYLLGKTFRDIRRCGRDWPTDQHAAVERFLMALWRQTLAAHDATFTPADVLEAAAEDDRTIEPLLRVWEQDPSEAAARQLAWFVGDVSVSSWSDGRYHREVDGWLDGGAPARMLEAALAATTDAEAATEYAEALQLRFERPADHSG